MLEPELIQILEGPTPDFRLSEQLWVQSLYEMPVAGQIAFCELRTNNGADIVERCQQAWREHRPVMLDFPDEIRMRQQIDIVAMRLRKVPEGMILMLWVQQPLLEVAEESEEDNDDNDIFSH